MITVSSLIHTCEGCSPPSPHGSFAYDCSCFLTYIGYSQASFILATLLQVFLVNLAALCCTVSMTLFQILHITFVASCTTSLGLSCSCHGFILHCQHGSSLKLLDNMPSFCQLSSDCFSCSTTPQILHAFTLHLSSRVHTF